MKKHTVALVLLLVLFAIVSATTVLAYTYRTTYTISENGTASYTMLPVAVASNNQWMVDNGFIINADALDTRIETLGGLIRPHMVTDNMTLTAVAVPTNSQTNLYFTTGNSLLSNFDIITGRDGYITTTDNSTLEPGANLETASENWTVEQTGWIDTLAGSDKNLVIKPAAFQMWVSNDDEISAFYFPSANWTNPTSFTDPSSHWANEAQAYNDNTADWADADGVAPQGTWCGYLILNHASIFCSQIRYHAQKQHDDAGDKIDVDVYDGSTWHDVYEGTFTENVWEIKDLPFPMNITQARVRIFNNHATNGAVMLNEFDFGHSTYPSLTATSVSSGEHAVKTTLGIATWANGNLLDFDGTAGSVVDLGASNNGSAKLWVSLWFKPNIQYDNTLAANTFLFNKALDATNYLRIWMRSGFGHQIKCRMIVGGVNKHLLNLTSPDVTAYLADTWYHILFSVSDTNGGRARVNNGAASIDADTTAVPNGGSEFVGSEAAATANGIDATIAFVTIGIDDLTLAEEAYLYAGYVPGDETDLWHMDEGTGTNIVSYGSAGNNGTAGAATSWTTGSGLRTFVLSIDGAEIGSHAGDVPDNSNDWIWAQNNVLPYSDNLSISVNGTQQLLYEPITYIVGNTLPDRGAGVSNNGTITWGPNPSGVTVSLGSLVSSGQPVPGEAIATPARDILPEVEVSDWFVDPDVTGALLTNPMRPFVTILSDSTTLTEIQAWRLLALAFVLLVTVSTARAVRGHHFITGIAGGASLGGMVALTIFPLWALVFIIGMVGGGLVAERSPSL